MAGRILYHLDFDKNQKSIAIDDSVQEDYLNSGEWYLLPELAFEAAKKAAEERLELAKKAAKKAKEKVEEVAENVCDAEVPKTKKGKTVEAGEVKNPTKDFEFHVKF